MPTSLSQRTKQEIQGNCNRFNLGNRSAWWLSKQRFFKLWPDIAPGHDFLLSRNYKTLAEAGVVACLEEYGKLGCTVKGERFEYAYVFSKLETRQLDAKMILQAISKGEFWWIDNLYLFFMQTQLAGFAYFDVDWSNLGMSRNSARVVFFDVDSAYPLNGDWVNLQHGNRNFHTLFVALQSEFKGGLKFFNIAVLVEIYIATVFAYILDNPRVLGRNIYTAHSYYRNGQINVPHQLLLDTKRRGIVREFLNAAVGSCREAASERILPQKALRDLRTYTLKALQDLSSLPAITPKPKPKPKPHLQPGFARPSVWRTMLIMAVIVGSSVLLRSLLQEMDVSFSTSMLSFTLFWIVAPATYVLTRSAWAVFLGQSLALTVPAMINGGLSDILEIDTFLFALAVALPPSLIFWGTKNKRLSAWTILSGVLLGVAVTDVYTIVRWRWDPTFLQVGIEFFGAVVAALVSVVIGKIFRKW